MTFIDSARHGEIRPEYRRHHIGYEREKRALRWMDKQGVKRKKLVIGAGNEEVIDFHRRFNFEMRSINMEQV